MHCVVITMNRYLIDEEFTILDAVEISHLFSVLFTIKHFLHHINCEISRILSSLETFYSCDVTKIRFRIMKTMKHFSNHVISIVC